MRQHLRWNFVALAPALALICTASLDAQALAENVPEIAIEPVEGFIKLPEGLYLGEGIGVATNSVVETSAEERLPPLAQDRGMAVLTNRPFMNGRWVRTVEARELAAWAAEFGCETSAQFSVKYVLSHPAVTCVLTETTNPDSYGREHPRGLWSVPGRGDQRPNARVGSGVLVLELLKHPLGGAKERGVDEGAEEHFLDGTHRTVEGFDCLSGIRFGIAANKVQPVVRLKAA